MTDGSAGLTNSEGVALAEALTAVGNVAGIGITVVAIDEDPPEIIYASEGAERIFGVTGTGLTGQSIWDFVAPQERAGIERRRRAVASGTATTDRFETVINRADGTSVPIEVALHVTSYQGRRAVVSFVFDISARARAIAALKESETRFRNLVEGAPDGVAIILRGCFAYVNPAAVRLLGAKGPEEVVGRPLAALMEPSDHEIAQQRIQTLLTTQRRFSDPAEYKSKHADGHDIYVEISSIPIEWQGEHAVLGFARDVTERKAMQARLLHKDRLAAVGTLSAGLAHEVNNPLAYLLLNLQYLERELGKLLGDRKEWQPLSDRLHDAVHGAERVAAIVRDLKAFARADDGAQQPVDLAWVVESAIRVAHNTVRYKARLLREIDSVGAVLGNPQRLEQVVLNLLINAAQALADGDVNKDSITVRLTRTESHAILSVTDTGPGMSERERQRIFEPFYTTKPPGVGTGLGLPICRSIVESVGGSLKVVSEPGQGASFEVRLPLTHEPPSYPPPPPNRTVARRGGRILVVDDEPALRSTLEALLSDHYEVRTVPGTAEAMRVLSEGADFDMVLCDMMMPDGTGVDFLKRIQEHYAKLENRLVFMTGGALSQRTRDFLANPQIRQLKKPFPLADIHRMLDDLAEQD